MTCTRTSPEKVSALAWDELSRKEKQIAVEKAKADAVTDVQLLQLAKQLGLSFSTLRNSR